MKLFMFFCTYNCFLLLKENLSRLISLLQIQIFFSHVDYPVLEETVKCVVKYSYPGGSWHWLCDVRM